jgi:acetyl-CoA C-acetyltransferase
LKLHTANLQVDLASGLILCSAGAAEEAGVPRDRWIFVHAAAHAHDEWFVSERAELASSPAIRTAGGALLEHAGLSIDQIAHVDLYSCFPSAVQIAAAELGLALDEESRPLTVTGGLTFAGGPGNNYSSHAIATMAARLREDPGSFGLVTALGWYATKHALGVYSTAPPRRPFREIDAGTLIERPPARRARTDFGGTAPIEAYTVPYSRDGEPEAAIVTALTPDGDRALARSNDPGTAAGLLGEDPLGREVEFDGAGSFSR